MMISISAYSIFASVVIFNLGFIAIVLLRNRTLYLQKYEVESLIILCVLSVIRLVFPLDIKYATIINSEFWIPQIENVLKTSAIAGITVGKGLVIIWAIGSIVNCIHTISKSYKTLTKIQSYFQIDCPQIERFSNLPKYRNVVITVTPEIMTPIVTGIFRPHIFLPMLDVTDIELEMILKHEKQHIKNGDIIIKCIFSVIEAMFWWNPSIKVFGKELENLLELYCDKGATSRMDKKQRELYCLTLLKVAKQSIKKNQEYGLVTSGFSKVNQLQIVKQRIEIVLDRNKKDKLVRKNLIAIIFICIFILSYLIIIQPHYNLSAGDSKGIVEVTSENAYIERDIYGTNFLILNGEMVHEVSSQELEVEPYKWLEIVEKQ